MTKQVVINKRFHGPPGSGNGGYSCGKVGGVIDGPAVVRLCIPPPLDVPMTVRKSANSIDLFLSDELVASGKPATVDVEIPEPPDFAAAALASKSYRGFESHYYPGCFVCGPERQHGDGLRIFAGPIQNDEGAGEGPANMVAATWIPDDSLLDSSGKVATEFIWAALDCPGAYAFPEPATGTILLGELAVAIHGSVVPGEKCVVIGWEISNEGRKHYTGTALFGESGSSRAVGYATWFEVPDAA